MIRAENISKTFNGIYAVKNVSFEVEEGQTMVLLGTSGCGKTTSLKMLNRLIEASSGKIYIDGKNIFESKPEILRRKIGYVSQNNGLFPHYTVAENIAIVPRLLKWDNDKISKRTNELLNQLKLPFDTYSAKYPEELSGGQKQRVALARALVSDPAVLLMDEPFGALDPITRVGIRKEFLDLPELKRKTIVMVTHDVSEAFELGDKICLMDKGSIVQTGTSEELIFNPDSDFVTSFFSHQRLQLELSSLKLKSIWEQLPDGVFKSENKLNSNNSLWEAMELMSEQNVAKLMANDLESKTAKEISMALLNTAYLQIKQKK